MKITLPGWLLPHPSPRTVPLANSQGLRKGSLLQAMWSCRPCDPGVEWTQALELRMAEFMTRSRLLLPPAGNTALSPHHGCQLDGTGGGGQLVLSHSQWNRVAVWMAGGSESSGSSQLVIVVLFSKSTKMTAFRVLAGHMEGLGDSIVWILNNMAGAELKLTMGNHQLLLSPKERELKESVGFWGAWSSDTHVS